MTTVENVYWKSLDALRTECRARPASRGSEFLERLPSPFEPPSAEVASLSNRRDFLSVLGFSLAAAACSRTPVQKAVPFVTQPEELTPGVAAWYTSTCAGCSAACSLLVKTRDGRPIKIEGNPESALFGGGTCAVGQATVLSLYDDERLRGPLWQGKAVAWDEIDGHIEERLRAIMAARGKVALLTGTIAGPATRDLIARWSRRDPGFSHVVYEPVSFTALRRATARCFGAAVVPRYHFDRARLVVGLDADFLGTWLSPVEFTRNYTRARQPGRTMARHIQFESGLSLTGANADVRHPVTPFEMGAIALALLTRLQAAGGRRRDDESGLSVDAALLDALSAELGRHRGEAMVVCGIPDVATQVIVSALNHELGAMGSLVDIDRPSLQKQADDAEMTRLVEQMHRGEIQALILYGVNPLYDYVDPAAFERGLEKVGLTISLADRLDESASRVAAVCPDHHFLEAWGDAEPVATSYSLAQPAIAPLFSTRAAQDSLLKWLGEAPDFHAYLRAYWESQIFPRQDRERDFDRFWDRTLGTGVLEIPRPAAAPPKFSGDVDAAAAAIRLARRQHEAAREPTRFSVHLHESVALRDGRHANNPWLQEMPDPITKLTWGHGAAMAPADAHRLGVKDGDTVVLRSGAARLELPVVVQPGQAPSTVSVALGYGRTHAGRAGNVGVNAYSLASLAEDGVRRTFAAGVLLEKTGRRAALSATQTHHTMDGRPLVREATLGAFLGQTGPPAGKPAALPSLWREHQAGNHTWGMAIDLGACTGCSACVVACQAENNVPVVGADEVRRGREMHWIRIDRYYRGPASAPDTVFEPVMCQHCANAPCETVCPVLATVHSSDGINQQIYNRCIGTRYCENNCPYKVRRFNWFTYARNPRFDFTMSRPLETMVLNPDVVVRSRGVMEKCSLCVQRIQAGKLTARQQGRPLADGDIRTACQETCPAEAIVFGDLQDPESRVSRLSRSSRHFHLLEGLGTKPGVGYLSKVRNRDA